MSSRFDLRVSRGGSWSHDDAQGLAARACLRSVPSNRYYDLGFRCARAESRHFLHFQIVARINTAPATGINTAPATGYVNGYANLTVRCVRYK